MEFIHSRSGSQKKTIKELLLLRPQNLPCLLPTFEPCSLVFLLFCESSDIFLINAYTELGRDWFYCLWLKGSNSKSGVQEKVSGPRERDWQETSK